MKKVILFFLYKKYIFNILFIYTLFLKKIMLSETSVLGVHNETSVLGVKNKFLVGLHYIGFTHKKLYDVFYKKQNYKEVYQNLNSGVLKKFWFNDKQLEITLKKYSKLNLDFLILKLEKRKARIVTIFDEEYPENLKNISHPPFLFYIRWKLDNSPKIAIVWARKISSYWNKVIEELIPDLSKYFIVVSGWAAGCDTKAHIETLSNKWKTIAVIWTWIDQDYPVWNEKLFWEIAEFWATISSFPIWEVGNPYNFPIRNEIVAWLSEGILIIEAREKSGSLITAKLWLDLWKDLFAVPGDIFKWSSVWTNNLIKKGEAKLVLKSSDILEEYNILNKDNNSKKNTLKEIPLNYKIKFADNLEKKIYNILILESLTIDELTKKVNENISTVGFKLSILEISWLISNISWWKYEIK